MSEERKLVEILGDYKLSTEELEQISQETAELVQKLELLEEEKKTVAADYKSQIDTVKSKMLRLARQTRTGIDNRYMNCYVEFNTITRKKQYFWEVDHRLVREEPMTPQEIAEHRQLKLSYGDEDNFSNN